MSALARVAIPAPRGGVLQPTVEALSQAANLLQGPTTQRAVRLVELLEAGVLKLETDGSVAPAVGRDATTFAQAVTVKGDLTVSGRIVVSQSVLSTGSNAGLFINSRGGTAKQYGWYSPTGVDLQLDVSNVGTVFKINNAGDVIARDFYASRGDGTGAVYLKPDGTRYLYCDGDSYHLNAGNLLLHGQVFGTWSQSTGYRGVMHPSNAGVYLIMGHNTAGDPNTYVGATASGNVIIRGNGNDSNGQLAVGHFGMTLLGAFNRRNATNTADIAQPRIFVQSADPGTAASDGDLWVWTGGIKRRSGTSWIAA